MALAALTVVAPTSGATAGVPPLDPAHPVIGTLESDLAHSQATSEAGARAVVIGLVWDRGEPQEGVLDQAYLDTVQARIDAFRAAGKLVVLDLGIQYPPQWIFRKASSHFVDQEGHAFVAAPGSGDCGVNLVFSDEMRRTLDVYWRGVFARLGHDFFAVRLGGGRYGELGYPGATFQRDRNCYWAFDSLAQGTQQGLPAGVQPCPVPGWKPGTPSTDHASARLFLDWYMESMRNYHDWQIAEARRFYAGPLFMLYPSTGGLRPGQLDAAIADDASGATGPEKTGEVGRGYDTARFIQGITDPQVVVYSTWVDGFPGCDDAATDSARWNPAHFLARLAAAHQPPLLCGGENTGHPDNLANMQVTLKRLQEDGLSTLFWAFEGTLFDGKPGHATVQDFKSLILHSGVGP